MQSSGIGLPESQLVRDRPQTLIRMILAHVCLGAHPLNHVRVVQLERRTLGTDVGQLGEVVPRRRAGGRPFQGVAVAPRVVDRDDLADGGARHFARTIAAIRKASPECYIVVDGIQHASHGAVDIAALGIDGYAVSPYKMFSRHGYGVGWASDRLTACTKETVIGGPATSWDMGTRDTGSYATFSDVVEYLAWLGGHFTTSEIGRAHV